MKKFLFLIPILLSACTPVPAPQPAPQQAPQPKSQQAPQPKPQQAPQPKPQPTKYNQETHTNEKIGSIVTGYTFDASDLPGVKDYEILKLVFARDILDSSQATPPSQIFHSLLLKAYEIGAHAIINTNIEKATTCQEVKHNIEKTKKCVTTRYGSALAIKYNKIKSAEDISNQDDLLSSSGIAQNFHSEFMYKMKDTAGNFVTTNIDKKGAVLKGQTFDVKLLPMKSWVPVKLVFSRAIIDDSDSNTPNMLYHDLLIKAAELGAHAVINVNIEETRFCENDQYKNGEAQKKCKITRYGSGLAIKYTNTVFSTNQAK